MRLIDIVNAPWAITPEMHREVMGIYARHMRGEKINIADVEARIGGPLPGPTKGYEVYNGVAVLPLEGVLAKRMNLFMQISGGTSMQIAANDFREALDDPNVNAIILAIDSPGGTVDGTQELAELVYSARGVKPVITFADGTMASAAYWIGSAAQKVFMSSDTATIGSIGVVAKHVDISRAEDMQGVKTTEITAGKYKRIASQYAPLSDEGRATLQDQVDQTYSVFVNAVARNRGVSVEQVLDRMADGRVFIGQQAIEAGLVDGVATLDDLINRAASGEFDTASSQNVAKGAGVAPAAKRMEDSMSNLKGAPAAATMPDDEEAKKKAAALAAEDVPDDNEDDEPDDDEDDDEAKADAFVKDHPRVAEILMQRGAAAERDRIRAVEEQAMPGHEALIAALKYDGKTSGPEAAVQVLKAEKAKKGKRVEDLKADADEARIANAKAPEGEKPQDQGAKINSHEVAAKAAKYQAEQRAKGFKISTAEAVDHVMKEMSNG